MDYGNRKSIAIFKLMVADGKITQAEAEKYCPEMAESDEERMRKELISYININEEYRHTIDIDTRNRFIAWIEKHGEQKPIYQKFRVGDKVKDNYLTYTVEGIDEDSYKLQAYSKDGHKGCTVYLTIGCEKGYELIEQKPVTWSDEDEKMLSDIIKDLVHPWNEYIPDRIEYEIKWLKNRLKSISPQSAWKPTIEQVDALQIAIENAEHEKEYSNQNALVSLMEDLNKL